MMRPPGGAQRFVGAVDDAAIAREFTTGGIADNLARRLDTVL
ncbi:hypothetical protein [Yoonia sp.]